MTDNSALTQLILDDRIRGRSYAQIEQKRSIPAIEAMALVREALETTTMRDPIEMRGIVMLRTEKVIEHLWEGLEQGSFKHGEAIIKAVERLSELLDLNQETIRHEVSLVSDEQTMKIFEVLKRAQDLLHAKINALELTDGARQELIEGWPEWAASSTTTAVEEVLYHDEEDGTYKKAG